MMEQNEEATVEGTDRRQFLKKAGVVAWTIPAMQVVNMTGAFAGEVNTSVTKTDPPSTTRPPPPCVEETFRIKANWNGDGWTWDTGVGANDCIKSGFDHTVSGADGPISIDGDDESVTVSHDIPECKIIMAYHKAGSDESSHQETACFLGVFDEHHAVFTAEEHDISHVELVLECCVPTDE